MPPVTSTASLAMQCIHCKGRMQRGVAAFSVDRSGYHIHWDAVPAWVCTQCGEPLFEAREVDLIQQALVALDRESRKLAAVRRPRQQRPNKAGERCGNRITRLDDVG